MVAASVLVKQMKNIKVASGSSSQTDHKYIIKKSTDLNIPNIILIEMVVQLMKQHPDYILDYLETCRSEDLHRFITEIP